tara:strand:+ start:971 stop:2332 length:1362 start_codon:yes stop_codon:yes gene_type:complete
MQKDLTQEWLNWIFENIQRGCDKNDLLQTLLKEGFSQSQSKIALGLDLSADDLVEVKQSQEEAKEYSANYLISAKRIPDVSAEIYEVENFLSQDECNLLVNEIKSALRPSTIASEGEFDSTYRTSSTCDLGNKNNPFLKEIDRRISDFIGIGASYGETLQGQHYTENQEFKAHTDYFEGSQLLEHDGGRGQRTYTFMIYLNEVEKGGETEFLRLNKTFSPTQGKALIWNNLNEDGTPNENTMHQAHPVEKGKKTIITKWFRQVSLNTEPKLDLNKHIKTFTEEGFKKDRLDDELFKKIKYFYDTESSKFKEEFVAGNFIQSDETNVPSELLDLTDDLRNEIHASLKGPLEEWSQCNLEPTFVYGIRDYKQGAVLIPHRDRKNTHIISAIINVAKDLDQDWPLVIEDHFYRKHEVFLEPGEIIYYESARLLHGRPYPMQGRSFANIFCHFTPVY